MYRFINCTPHEVVLFGECSTAVQSWPAATASARIVERSVAGSTVPTEEGLIPVTDIYYEHAVENLPEQQPSVFLIVSRPLAMRVDRDDLVFPFDDVRDGAGRILGCRGFGRFRSPASHA